MSLSCLASAQLGGGGQPRPANAPEQPQAPRPVTQDGVRVAPQATNPGAAQVKRMVPPLKVSPEKIDLGVIRPQKSKAGSVTLTNTGAETIKIARVNSSCSCTVADLPKRELAPGESVELSATLDAGEFIGSMQRTVRVYVEGYAPPFEVWVVADVAYDIKADPVFVGAFQSDTGEVNVTEVNGKPFRILSVNNKPATIKDFTGADEPRSEYTLQWDVRGTDPKDLPQWWIVETDHPEAPVVDLRVLHPSIMPRPDPRRAWLLGADRSILGYVEPGKATNFTVLVKERRRSSDELVGDPEIVSKSDNIKVSFVSMERTDEGYSIEVSLTGTPRADGSTLINEPITIKWRDSEETYWVFGRLAARPDAEPRAAR